MSSRFTQSKTVEPSVGPPLIGALLRVPLEVAEAFELTEQVVDGLLAHPESRRELRRARSLRPWVEEDVDVCGVEVLEPPLVQPLEHPSADGLPRKAQERADQRRAEGPLRGRSKGT